MEISVFRPSTLTLLSTLSACASHGALEAGPWIHSFVNNNDLNRHGSLDSSLIDMYSKCGDIAKAIQIFEESPERDLFTWTSIICGLAMHGHVKKALCYFSEMYRERARRRLVLEAALEESRIVALALMMFTCIRIRVF